MTAFPGKLRGSSESILSGEARSRNTVLEKSMQMRSSTLQGRVGQSHLKHSLSAALQQSWQDPFFVLFGLLLESSPNTEIFPL